MYDFGSGQLYLINQLLNLKNTVLPINCYILAKQLHQERLPLRESGL